MPLHICTGGYNKNRRTAVVLWECGEIALLGRCWWKYKLVQPLWKTAWQFFKRFDVVIVRPSNSAPRKNTAREMKSDICLKTYTCIVVAALFLMPPKWKQPKYPTTDEWKCRCGPYSGILFGNKKEWSTNTCHSTSVLRTLCWVKADSHKRQGPVWLHWWERPRTGWSAVTVTVLVVA